MFTAAKAAPSTSNGSVPTNTKKQPTGKTLNLQNLSEIGSLLRSLMGTTQQIQQKTDMENTKQSLLEFHKQQKEKERMNELKKQRSAQSPPPASDTQVDSGVDSDNTTCSGTNSQMSDSLMLDAEHLNIDELVVVEIEYDLNKPSVRAKCSAKPPVVKQQPNKIVAAVRASTNTKRTVVLHLKSKRPSAGLKTGARISDRHLTWKVHGNVQTQTRTAVMTASVIDELQDHVPELSSTGNPASLANASGTPKTTAVHKSSQRPPRPRTRKSRDRRRTVEVTFTTTEEEKVKHNNDNDGKQQDPVVDSNPAESLADQDNQSSQPSIKFVRRKRIHQRQASAELPVSALIPRVPLRRQNSTPVREVNDAPVGQPPEFTTKRETLRKVIPLPWSPRLVVRKRLSPSPPAFVNVVLRPVERVVNSIGKSRPVPLSATRPAIPIPPIKRERYVPRWRRAQSEDGGNQREENSLAENA